MIRWLIPAAVFACGLRGQQISVPVLGYVWDGEIHGLRPLVGTPGATAAGALIQPDSRLDSAQPAPTRKFAVAVDRESGAATIWQLEPAAAQVLKGVHPHPDRFVLSPEGSAAAFYFSRDRSMQVVSGLPDQPSSPRTISLAPLRNPMEAFTVSDDGEMVLCLEGPGGANSDPPAAVALSEAGDLNRITLSSRVTAASFRPRTHDALMAGGDQLVLIRDVAAGVRTHLESVGLAPTAVAFAPDGQSAILADGLTGRIAIADLRAPGETVMLNCDCTPNALSPIGGGSVYRLTDYSNSPMRMLDLSTGRPRVVSVPPRVVTGQ